MNVAELESLCDAWLASWTGNRPAVLVDYFAVDAVYRDPARPKGIQGREALFAYFTKLLAGNPDWVWTREELIPTAKGFTLKWRAEIPTRNGSLQEFGLDIVELDAEGKITRNEVYFDRVNWMKALAP